MPKQLSSCISVHNSKDRILLEGEDHGEDEDEDEDEVFALKGMPEDSDEGSDEDDVDEEMDDAKAAPPDKKFKKAKGKKGKISPPSSDASVSESEEEGWGKKSEYYASNAGQIDSDDEEANELEEQEAKRLQTKAREILAEDDFGFGDAADAVTVEVDECVPVTYTDVVYLLTCLQPSG